MIAVKLLWRCPFHRNSALARLGFAATMRSASACAMPLKEMGRYEPIKENGVYNSGQLFLHKVFAYRGVILSSSQCKVFEKSKGGNTIEQAADGTPVTPSSSGREQPSKLIPYYQVLIHKGDWTDMRLPADMTTYLAELSPGGERSFCTLNGIDYVSHEDILPYASKETDPIDHELFPKFIEAVPPAKIEGPDGRDEFVRLTSTEMLRTWIGNNKFWLTPTEVHRETTEGVRVTAMSFYLGAKSPHSRMGSLIHVWRYNIRIENFNQTSVTLRDRSWKIFSLSGNLQQYSGPGVIGYQPLLSPTQPAYQYSSHIELDCPKGGHMWGMFKMERENGTFFDASIPCFVLEGKRDLPNP